MSKRLRSLIFSFFSFLFFLASCADIFQPKIPMSSTKGSLDNLFDIGEEITKLGTPMQFYVAPYYSSSEIRLTWNAVRGAAYYMVERAVAAPGAALDGSEFETLERFVYGTSYADVILQNPTLTSPEFKNEYFYRVSAFNTKLKYEESEPTIAQSAMLFRAPEGLKASGGTSIEQVELTWQPSPGANGYEVWRSDFDNGASATLLATVWGNQNWYYNKVSTAEQGRDFYYMIKAKNSFGCETPRTDPAYGYARVYGAPNKPENVHLAANSGRGHSTTEITIEWDEVLDDGVYYAVYRSSETDSSLTRLTLPTGTTQTFWEDSVGLKPGIFYYYKVQAIVDDISSGKALKSQFSSNDLYPPETESFLLGAPEEVVAEKNNDDGTVTVKWKPAMGTVGERERYIYNVYAGDAMEGVLANCVAPGVDPNTNTEGDWISASGLSLAGAEFFRVSTVNGAAESSQSVVVSPTPAKAIIQGASQYAYIAGENANPLGVYPVRITWKKPENETPAFYRIERSQRTGTGFTKINDAPLRADGTGTEGYSLDANTGIYTYIDRNETARVARKYYYRVVSLNKLEQGSVQSQSDERIGWGALTHTQYILEYNKTMGSALKKLTYMHKPGSTDKLGTETKYGAIGGSIYYNAALDGLGAYITIRLTNYADFYIENEPANGIYFTLNGNSDTSANMSSNGDMKGTVTCAGMYPGKVSYDRIQIKGGAAGGGTYGVEPDGFPRQELSWTVLE